MDHTTQVFPGLFVVVVAAQIGAEIAQRLKLPAVVQVSLFKDTRCVRVWVVRAGWVPKREHIDACSWVGGQLVGGSSGAVSTAITTVL